MKWSEIEANRRLTLAEPMNKTAVLVALGGVLKHAEMQRASVFEDAETAVHEWRKSIRRARALMRMIEPALGRRSRRELDRELRKLVRATSSLRDSDVIRDTVEKFVDHDALPEASSDALRQALDHSLSCARGATPEQVLCDFEEATHTFFLHAKKTLPKIRKRDLRLGIEVTYRDAREALRETLQSGEDDAVHSWRKRVKELRYQLEALPGERAAQRERDLGTLAQSLGEVTDQMVLGEFIGREVDDECGLVGHHVRERVVVGIDACARAHALLFIPRASIFAREVLP